MMITKLVRIDELHMDESAIEAAGKVLAGGGLVAFPTETVYGLGANGLDSEASARIYEAKGRPSDNPLILHITSMEELVPLVVEIPKTALALAGAFWPGPLTMIFKKTEMVPYETTGGLETVAVRMPSHPVARAIIQAAGIPVAAPSANASGRPSPTRALHVLEDLDGRVDMVVDGGTVGIGLESTIIDVSGEKPVILRPGYITEEMFASLVGKVELDPAITGEPRADLRPRAPGMKYRHYAPKAELTVFLGSPTEVCAAIEEALDRAVAEGKRAGVLCTEESQRFYDAPVKKCAGSRNEPESVARGLYEALRAFDREQVDCIFSESFEESPLSGAIMNRLLKAAGYRTVRCGKTSSVR